MSGKIPFLNYLYSLLNEERNNRAILASLRRGLGSNENQIDFYKYIGIEPQIVKNFFSDIVRILAIKKFYEGEQLNVIEMKSYFEKPEKWRDIVDDEKEGYFIFCYTRRFN